MASVETTIATAALEHIAAGGGDGSVEEVARTLAVSPRHLTRVVREATGLTPGRLAALRRAQSAALLLRRTTMPITDVAFAAGYASVRQFNDAIRAEFAATPTQVRRGGVRGSDEERDDDVAVTIRLQLGWTRPYATEPMWRHLSARAISGLEVAGERTLTRVIVTSKGPVLVAVDVTGAGPQAHLELASSDLLPEVLTILTAWLDLDAPVAAIDAHLAAETWLAPLVAATPGIRVPGSVDPDEMTIRAVLGQQISTAAARTYAGRLVAQWGEAGPGGLRLFPTRETLAALSVDDVRGIGLTGSKAATIVAVSRAEIDYAAEPDRVRRALLAVRGIGNWTADYVAMRSLRDRDVLPLTDLVIRQMLTACGAPHESYPQLAPWRSYVAAHLWYKASYRSTKGQP